MNVLILWFKFFQQEWKSEMTNLNNFEVKWLKNGLKDFQAKKSMIQYVYIKVVFYMAPGHRKV